MKAHLKKKIQNKPTLLLGVRLLALGRGVPLTILAILCCFSSFLLAVSFLLSSVFLPMYCAPVCGRESSITLFSLISGCLKYRIPCGARAARGLVPVGTGLVWSIALV